MRLVATVLAITLAAGAARAEDRPAPLTNRIAPDAFEGAEAVGITEELTSRFPDRKPGSAIPWTLSGHARIGRGGSFPMPAARG